MSILAFLLMGLAQAAPAAIPTAIHLRDDAIRAGDIAMAGAQADTVVARLPRGTGRLEIGRDEAERLLARRFPGRRFALAFADRAVLLAAAAPPALQAPCYRAAEALGAGEAVTADRVATTPCDDGAARGALSYSPAVRGPVARTAIAAGDYLGAIRPAVAGLVGAGRRLLYRTGEGPVTVERQVVTVQPSRAGQRVFARTEDGAVIAARILPEDAAPPAQVQP